MKARISTIRGDHADFVFGEEQRSEHVAEDAARHFGYKLGGSVWRLAGTDGVVLDPGSGPEDGGEYELVGVGVNV